MAPPTNLWSSAEHALAYLGKAEGIPHRQEAEAALFEHLPLGVERVLDIGTGDGRLLAQVLAGRPEATGVGLDFSPTMLAAAGRRFAGDPRVEILAHDISVELPRLGPFDAVVSSFAIHHCEHERKRTLYAEVFDRLAGGGMFLNLEHVASPTANLHRGFLLAVGMDPDDDDPSNILLDVGSQLAWLVEIGFEDVDCHWKWREMALLAGRKP